MQDILIETNNSDQYLVGRRIMTDWTKCARCCYVRPDIFETLRESNNEIDSICVHCLIEMSQPKSESEDIVTHKRTGETATFLRWAVSGAAVVRTRLRHGVRHREFWAKDDLIWDRESIKI